jgi:DNA-binding MarR family transcriptional regulator
VPQDPASARATALAGRLHSAAIHLLRLLRAQDEATGLSGPAASALSVIVVGGSLTLGALAAAEQVRPPTITRLVQGLERAGLVRRERDPKDHRVQRVHATTKGRRVLLAGRERRVATVAASLARLPRAQLAALERAATILEGVLRASPSSPRS